MAGLSGIQFAPEYIVQAVLVRGDYSSDFEKMYRWDETVQWATDNGCIHLIPSIPEYKYYCVEEPTGWEWSV